MTRGAFWPGILLVLLGCEGTGAAPEPPASGAGASGGVMGSSGANNGGQAGSGGSGQAGAGPGGASSGGSGQAGSGTSGGQGGSGGGGQAGGAGSAQAGSGGAGEGGAAAAGQGGSAQAGSGTAGGGGSGAAGSGAGGSGGSAAGGGSGQAGSGVAGSGGSGGSGQAGSGQAGSGQAGSGQAGSGQAGSGGSGGAGACLEAELAKGPAGKVPPVGTPNAFMLGGQQAYYHDEGFAAGYFHTYDALDVDKPGTAPHKVNVFLPRGYEADKGKSYPVVYMQDGQTSFFPGGPGNKSWRMHDALAALYACGVGEVIVVAVWPVNRNQEYTLTAWQEGKDCCGVAAYASYLAGPVKGFIDAQYRTRPGRLDTMIVGSSHGGLSAFYVAGTHPESFGRAIAMSSSFWAGLDFGLENKGGPLSSSALLAATKGALSDPALRPRLWIDWGLVREGGTHNSVIEELATERGREMRDLLVSSHGYTPGSDLFAVEDPAGEHEENSWARRLPGALLAVLGASE